MSSVSDPYGVLGVSHEATPGEIKAAHRRLAKRYHPDAADGDTERFLAVQNAYQVLSDPLTRREWDARHRPGPVRADSAGAGRGRPGRGAPRGRGGLDRRGAAAARGAAGDGSPADAAAGDPGAAGPRARPGQARRRRPRPDPFSPSGRAQTADSYTWSAQDVPWWSTGPGRSRPTDGTHAQGAPEAAPETPPVARTPATAPGPTGDLDVYNRSSGAAWSMASRAYFRKAGADLPRGAAEPFGQRWTTPPGKASAGPGPSASARPAEPAARAAPAAAPHPATAAADGHASHTARASVVPARPRPAPVRLARPMVGARATEGVVFGSAAVAGLRRRLVSSAAWPSLSGRLLYAFLAWLAPAILLVLGPLSLPVPLMGALLAGLLVAFALVPQAAYLAAAGGTAALVVAAGVVLGEAASGTPAPAPFDLIAAVGVLVVYGAAAGLAAVDWPLPRPWRDVP